MSKTCKYCNLKWKERYMGIRELSGDDYKEGHYFCSQTAKIVEERGKYLLTGYNNGTEEIVMAITHCPWCGRKLEMENG